MCTTCCDHSCYNPTTALPNEKGLRLDVRLVFLSVTACPFAARQVWWGYNRNDPPALSLKKTLNFDNTLCFFVSFPQKNRDLSFNIIKLLAFTTDNSCVHCEARNQFEYII